MTNDQLERFYGAISIELDGLKHDLLSAARRGDFDDETQVHAQVQVDLDVLRARATA